ncbi:MAG: hypothetical protein GWN58_52900 [Anaerolineae bacterium]|nr:hypothetical protein [Anaerolineae bacterium]
MGGIGKFVSKAIGGVTGLLAPEVKEPKPVEAKKQFLDPNRGKRIAAARKAKGKLAKGRSSLKIDLNVPQEEEGSQVREGLTIG